MHGSLQAFAFDSFNSFWDSFDLFMLGEQFSCALEPESILVSRSSAVVRFFVCYKLLVAAVGSKSKT